jgi:hypothetical protein
LIIAAYIRLRCVVAAVSQRRQFFIPIEVNANLVWSTPQGYQAILDLNHIVGSVNGSLTSRRRVPSSADFHTRTAGSSDDRRRTMATLRIEHPISDFSDLEGGI